MKHTPKTIAEAMDPGMGEIPDQVDEDHVGLVQLSVDDWGVVVTILENAAKESVNLGEQGQSDARRINRIAQEIRNSAGDEHPNPDRF